MPELVDSLANLTALRDRDALDVALVSTIRDLLQPESAAIYRCVGNAGDERWLTCAHLTAENLPPRRDSEWVRVETLPTLAEHPARQQAILSQKVCQSTQEEPFFTVFPLTAALEAPHVLEVGSREVLAKESRRLVVGILRLYHNFQGLLDYGERDSLTELLNRKTFDGTFMKVPSNWSGLSTATTVADVRQTNRECAGWR
jgi:hypothetical protein